MALAQIIILLQESIGLHSRSIGEPSIERAIQHRMQANALSNTADYLALLQRSVNEFNELVEEVVVPETWFFRNTSPFDALVNYIPAFSTNRNDQPSSPLKILSLPCSTGEEPYSIAMVLMEKGMPLSSFSIDAFDVSQRAIEKAKLATYGENSFREKYRGLRSKYFRDTKLGYSLSDEVKKHVTFSQGNIIKDEFREYLSSYDIIFCRNLLIYFDRKTQSLVLDKLYHLLKSDGVLCVGHAESYQVPSKHFQSLDIPMAFAFRKTNNPGVSDSSSSLSGFATTDVKRKASLKSLKATYHDLVGVVENSQRMNEQVSRDASKDSSVKNITVVADENSLFSMSSKESPSGKSDGGPVRLGDISSLIEKGQLLDAAELTENYLIDTPESSEAYYYLGLISHLEGGSSAAESLLKKAIYLDPHHHAAIGLLVVLADGRDDIQQADAYRRRQQRAIHHRSKDD